MRTSVIREAIASHAVLLNRVAWLAPERMDVQAGVWTRLVERQDGDGVVALEDFERGTVWCINRRPEPPIGSITPADIVETAAKFARDRALRVDEMLANINTPEVFLARAIDVITRSDAPALVAIEVRDEIASDLSLSEVDDNDVARLLSAVERILGTAAAHAELSA